MPNKTLRQSKVYQGEKIAKINGKRTNPNTQGIPVNAMARQKSTRHKSLEE